jgi:hypothetical protein
MAVDLGPDGLTLGSTTINDWADVGGGKIAQVKMGSRTSVLAISNTSWNNICSIAITPSSTSSKIMINAHTNWGGGDDVTFRIYCSDGRLIGVGDSNGSRTRCTFAGGARNSYEMANGSGTWLDSPSTTSSRTYYLQVHRTGGGTCYVNRGPFDEDQSHQEVGSSAIVVAEVTP